ncbi:hypothetical protein DFS34DRAFT_145236 [Phlyctochytrium arcticum]|nr:hypothetical protein DFS34DRAFT_145236 [Phlyctochytrium arcticum]
MIGESAKQSEAVYTALAANPQLGRFIKTMLFSGDNVYELDSSTLFSTVASLCPNLKDLELHKCLLNDQDLSELAKKSEKLARLALWDCYNITAEGWIKAAPFLRQLRRLEAYQFPDFGDKAVRAIVDSCPLLEGVILYNTDLTCDEISYLMLNAPALLYLSISRNKRIERRGFEDILSQRPARLKELCVRIRKGQCYYNRDWKRW